MKRRRLTGNEGRGMRSLTRSVVAALCAAALVSLAGASGGCAGLGSDSVPQPSESPSSPGAPSSPATPAPQQPEWENVVSARVSGDRPVKLSLGIHTLGDRVRLAWVLSGPKNPPVTLTLRIINVSTGIGYGQTASPRSDPQPIVRRDDRAMVLAPIWPGEYRIYFSQRFPQQEGPGYDVKLTISTRRQPSHTVGLIHPRQLQDSAHAEEQRSEGEMPQV